MGSLKSFALSFILTCNKYTDPFIGVSANGSSSGGATGIGGGRNQEGRKVVDVRTSRAQQEAIRRITRYRELSKIVTLQSVPVDLLDILTHGLFPDTERTFIYYSEFK